jgi:hypothetical protein
MKAVLVGLAVAVLFCATLLFSGSRILVYEVKVNPGDAYGVDGYGESSQGSLVCRYFTGRSILTRVFWHSRNDSFGKDQCPFILDESN